MKLYRLQPTGAFDDSLDYQTKGLTYDFVIWAEDEEQARGLAQDEAGEEIEYEEIAPDGFIRRPFRLAWLRPAQTTCTEIKLGTEPWILVAAYVDCNRDQITDIYMPKEPDHAHAQDPAGTLEGDRTLAGPAPGDEPAPQ